MSGNDGEKASDTPCLSCEKNRTFVEDIKECNRIVFFMTFLKEMNDPRASEIVESLTKVAQNVNNSNDN